MKICTNTIMLGGHARHHIAGDGMNIIAWIAGLIFHPVHADSITALVVGLIFAGRCGKAYRDSDYELMCELQQKRSEIRLEIRLDYEEEDEPIE